MTIEDYDEQCQQVQGYLSAVTALLDCLDDINELQDMQRHLDHLSKRVRDKTSKIFITGDLNSGKSTLCNALLKSDILPVDQQPCTSIFCEIVPSDKQVVHGIQDTSVYSPQEPSTYHLVEPRHLYNIMTADEDKPAYSLLKIYGSSLHHTLIDSPGLNTDSLSTTSIFALQESIDIVVFCLSAENHFTLSGKEFLSSLANEKQHVFIVVNRFDMIRDQNRCQRLIMEQIKEVSPATFENADDLVHFISATESDQPQFKQLEEQLDRCVLANRTQHKLLPAKTYMIHVLQDMLQHSATKQDKAEEQLGKDHHVLNSEFLPQLDQFVETQQQLTKDLDSLKQDAVTNTHHSITTCLKESTSQDSLSGLIESVEYPGFFKLWQYGQDISDALSNTLQDNIQHVESTASESTVRCMQDMNSLTQKALQQDITIAVHQSEFIHQPHRVHVKVQARDFLMNQRIVDDKKVAASALGLMSAAALFFKVVSIKDLALNIASRYINPLDDSMDTRRITYPLTALTAVSVGYSCYSFIAVMPRALRINLRNKFQHCLHTQNMIGHTTQRITDTMHHVLEAKQTEIVSRVQQLLDQKKETQTILEHNVFVSTTQLNQLKQLVKETAGLLHNVDRLQFLFKQINR